MAFKTLNIGATALLTQRYALDTTGQNIANASTPGYSRQRLATQANRPEVQSFGALGTGVGIRAVQRVADEFLEKQVRGAKGSNDRLETLSTGYENIQVFFNELTENDISTALDSFWDALSDFANNAEEDATRRAALEKGTSLVSAVRSLDSRLRDYRVRENEAIVDLVSQVNSLTGQIAQLNRDIMKTESGGATGVTANDLRDQRTERLKELGGLMDITVTEEPNGSTTVSQKSRVLVYQDKAFALSTRSVDSEDMLVAVPVYAEDEDEVVMTDGQLYAHVQMRDQIILGYKDQIDQFAASLAWEFNRVHTQSIGLAGYSTLTAVNAPLNPDATLNQLDYGFTPEPDTFEIVNGNLEIIVHDEVSDEEIRLNVEIDLDGRPGPNGEADTILWDPLNPALPNSLLNRLQTAFDSIRPGLFTVSLDQTNHLTIASNNSEFTFGFGRDSSGVLSALGMNTFFSGHDARTLELNDRINAAPELVGGARSFVPGDNSGAVALLDLRDARVLSGGTVTIAEYYQGVVSRLGVEGGRIESLREVQEDILTRMENQREDLSGVNLDEELTKMIQYQRSFQSAARFVSTADSILETLINM